MGLRIFLLVVLYFMHFPVQAETCLNHSGENNLRDIAQVAHKCKDHDDDIPDLRKGCHAIGTCGLINNRNRFRDNKEAQRIFVESGGCDQPMSCPEGTVPVCSREYSTKVCMDKHLKKEPGSDVPHGYQTYYTCQSYCESRNMRLPSNNEWLVAAAGTDPDKCLPEKIVHPIFGLKMSWSDKTINQKHLPKNRDECVSLFGIHDAVGVLGQWVQGTFKRKGQTRAQFNGGLYPQKASTLFYRTSAHGPGYGDYSIGCRCATHPQN